VSRRRLLLATLAVALLAGAFAAARIRLEAGIAVALVVMGTSGGIYAVFRMVEELLAPVRPRGRAGFSRGYPRTPELDRLVQAFERGDYAEVRQAAPRLVEESGDEDVRKAAQDLRRRIAPDPTAVFLLLLGVALALTVTGYYLWGDQTHGKATAASRPFRHVT
jgi:hypothetical protein